MAASWKGLTMNCPTCDSELPQDALFCVECGASVIPAATGPTTRIDMPAGPRCAACNTVNPLEAQFCVTCGRTLAPATPVQVAPALGKTQPTIVPPAPTIVVQQPQQPLASKRMKKKHHQHGLEGLAGVIFMIGLAMLFTFHAFWPGILLLIGITAFLTSMGRGQPRVGMQNLIWMAGLMILLSTGAFWPGILILVGISSFFNRKGRSCWGRW